MIKRRIAELMVLTVGFVIVFFGALAAWNVAMARRLHAAYPTPGNSFYVHGEAMHIYCVGSGQPTLVMESGATGDWLNWQLVQPQLAQITTVCSYDRAGHGWSTPRSGSRDAATIANELHDLLKAAGIKGPLVLVGYSAGGLYVREYFQLFPQEIVGIALFDSSSPKQIEELPGFRSDYEADKRDAFRELWWERLRVWSGWERLTGKCKSKPSAVLSFLSGYFDAERCRPGFVGGEDGELFYFETATIQAGKLTSLGDLPLLIISEDPSVRVEGMTADDVLEAKVWNREQEESKSLSTRGWRVVAKGSTHALQRDRPDVEIAELTQLVNYLKGGQAPSFGTTEMK